jgi:hypothetical protein
MVSAIYDHESYQLPGTSSSGAQMLIIGGMLNLKTLVTGNR